MNMPGFTAEQALRQHQHGGNYFSTDWPLGGVGDVCLSQHLRQRDSARFAECVAFC
jgi:hypothetical protein